MSVARPKILPKVCGWTIAHNKLDSKIDKISTQRIYDVICCSFAFVVLCFSSLECPDVDIDLQLWVYALSELFQVEDEIPD